MKILLRFQLRQGDWSAVKIAVESPWPLPAAVAQGRERKDREHRRVIAADIPAFMA